MPATASRTEDPTADKIFSERELEDQQQGLVEARERLEELEEREEELSEEIAERIADGEDPEDLREERSEVSELATDYRAAIPVLEERIRERRLRRLRHLAEERLQEIKKKVGGLAGEQPRKAERAVEALREARRKLEALADAHARGRVLREEAKILADTFGLDVPELKRVPAPRSHDELDHFLPFRPGKILESEKRKASGAGRATSRYDDPRRQLRQLEGIDVPWTSPAADLLDRLAELEEGGSGE